MAEYIINTDMIPVEIPDKSEVVTFFGEAVKELIRCKDCFHCSKFSVFELSFCAITGNQVTEDDFCSWAERKEKCSQ